MLISVTDAAAALKRSEDDVNEYFTAQGFLAPQSITPHDLDAMAAHFGPTDVVVEERIASVSLGENIQCRISAAGFDGDSGDVTDKIIAKAATQLGITASWLKACLESAAREVSR